MFLKQTSRISKHKDLRFKFFPPRVLSFPSCPYDLGLLLLTSFLSLPLPLLSLLSLESSLSRDIERYEGLRRFLSLLLLLSLLLSFLLPESLLLDLSLFFPPLLISTFTLLPQTLVPSRPLAASSASLASSISTNANPGGLLATQTSLTGPYFAKASSKSYLLASSLNPPIYILQAKSQFRWAIFSV